jgi:hypothetical protein
MVTSNETMVLLCFVKKTLQAFLDAKSSRTISESMPSKTFFSMLHIAKPFYFLT